MNLPTEADPGFPVRPTDRLRTCRRRVSYRTHYWTELRRGRRSLATLAVALVEPLRTCLYPTVPDHVSPPH